MYPNELCLQIVIILLFTSSTNELATFLLKTILDTVTLLTPTREMLPGNYNCPELLPDSYNSRELLPDSYSCHKLILNSYTCRELLTVIFFKLKIFTKVEQSAHMYASQMFSLRQDHIQYVLYSTFWLFQLTLLTFKTFSFQMLNLAELNHLSRLELYSGTS